MKCPRKSAALTTEGDTGKLGPNCPECMNYFFGDCIADKPEFVYRIPTANLTIYAVGLRQILTRETTVYVYAMNEEEAELAVEADLENAGGVMYQAVESGEEDTDGDVEVDIYYTPKTKKASLVAYDGKIFSLEDFNGYINKRDFEDGEELPVVAEA